MKRQRIARRRDRRTGLSPYQRHAKAPYRYSSRYYDWYRATVGKVAKSQQEAA